MSVLIIPAIENLLFQDELFFGPQNGSIAHLLLPTVRKLPIILADMLYLMANVRTIAEARRRFIQQSIKDGVHWLADEVSPGMRPILEENWKIELSKLDNLIHNLDKIKAESNSTDIQILAEQLQMDANVIEGLEAFDIGDILHTQPSVICLNPFNNL